MGKRPQKKSREGAHVPYQQRSGHSWLLYLLQAVLLAYIEHQHPNISAQTNKYFEDMGAESNHNAAIIDTPHYCCAGAGCFWQR
jgi:hypothetical protein